MPFEEKYVGRSALLVHMRSDIHELIKKNAAERNISMSKYVIEAILARINMEKRHE